MLMLSRVTSRAAWCRQHRSHSMTASLSNGIESATHPTRTRARQRHPMLRCTFAGSAGGLSGPISQEMLHNWVKRRSQASNIQDELRQPSTVEKLYVGTYGNGAEHVLMLHGLGADHQYFLPLLNNMNLRKYRYVCPDLLGHGRSDAAPQLDYDVETHLFFIERDALSAMSESSVTSRHAAFHIIGHGLGAILALELASRLPERILSLSMISMPYFDDELQATQQYLAQVAGPLARLRMFAQMIAFTSSDWMKGVADIVRPVNFVSESLKPDQLHAIVASFQACILRHRVDISASRLSTSAKFPILLLHGTEDTQVPRQRIDAFFSRHGRMCRLDLFQGGGHDLCRTHADQVARILTAAVLD